MKTITHNGKEYTFGNVVVNGVSREITDDEGVIYAEIKEQLDLLYHDMAADKGDKTGEWFKAIKAVKDATAKPE